MHPIVIAILVWVATILLSLWMLYYIASSMVVAFANNGLLLNTRKMPSTGNHTLTFLFIPIVNLCMGFYLGITYSQRFESIAASSFLYTDPMTDEQKARWEKEPKFLTAVTMMSENLKKEDEEKVEKMEKDIHDKLDKLVELEKELKEKQKSIEEDKTDD